MVLYADDGARRARQLLSDVLLVAWVVVWLRLSAVVHDATTRLAEPGRRLEDAGSGLAGRLRDAGSAVGGLPVVGDKARAPFEGAGAAADRVADAGTSQVEAVQHLAFWLAVCVAAIPVLLALAVYLPRRWRFVATATASRRFLDSAADLDLFALRAMAHQPLPRLAAVSPDPVRAWRDGDPDVVRALALLELRDAGIRVPDAVASGRGRMEP